MAKETLLLVDDGFTLIEMLLSLFIVSIIATFVIINLTTEVRDTNLSTTSLKVQSIIEMTRSCALSTAQETELKLGSNNLQSSCIDSQLSLEGVILTSNFPNQTIEFNSNGNVKRGGTIDLCQRGKCQSVVIGIGASDVKIK